MDKMAVLAVLTLVLVVKPGYPYMSYQNSIPNGDKVPDPCCHTVTWGGVGHQDGAGSGTQNPFGTAFAAGGNSWMNDLCLLDSDGDGKTNGQELGDPDCIWTAGDTPTRTDGLSHPGICEPLDSPTCETKNAWDVCAGRTVCDPTTTTSTTTTTTSTTTTTTSPTTTTSTTTSTTSPTTTTSTKTSTSTTSTTPTAPVESAAPPNKYHAAIISIMVLANAAWLMIY